MREKAINKIKSTPEIVNEVIVYGGYLMVDLNTGNIYYCNEDGKTFYQKWNNERNKFVPFMWQRSGLHGLDLDILDSNEYSVN
jgi:hypothetical protein